MLSVINIAHMVFNFFVGNKCSIPVNKNTDAGQVIKATGDISVIEIANLKISTELFFCDNKQTFLDYWTEFYSGRLIILSRSYNSDELYKLIVESITYFENSQWTLSTYSHCVKISKVTSDKSKYTLVVG